VDVFDVVIDTPEALPWGVHRAETVIRVDTSVGVRGYAFTGQERPPFYARGSREEILRRAVRPAVVGADLFSIERVLKKSGFLCGPLEHALWDALGKVVGQPVHRLLGGGPRRIKVYLTCVWPGVRTGLWSAQRPGSFAGERPGLPEDEPPRVPEASYEEHAAWAVKLRDAGYCGMKIGTFRPDPLDVTDACLHIREVVGVRSGFCRYRNSYA
jgi:L-alanine-DL-glutamate epimerase-like enolase superfamily enzyme